ncbi:PREDICTED: serine/arginine repetitive matrix protein 2-like [Priapulus caudatus]|uniref:Serine/arginine repetitive matrix protein 2-like n=1 Tax=Priapulus caudatus TaxID=37621 RepID=A0ABM1E0B8_PRICU|nr:PREDICTED: serine/arginine repetitive matrix protein 2-like [Priapulus caudatus]
MSDSSTGTRQLTTQQLQQVVKKRSGSLPLFGRTTSTTTTSSSTSTTVSVSTDTMSAKLLAADELEKQNPVSSSKPHGKFTKNAQKNVLRHMTSATGPLGVLNKCVQERIRVKVWTRSYNHIRGICTGYIVAFDKHWNLAMVDVDEVYINPMARKKAEEEIAKKIKRQDKKRRHRRATQQPVNLLSPWIPVDDASATLASKPSDDREGVGTTDTLDHIATAFGATLTNPVNSVEDRDISKNNAAKKPVDVERPNREAKLKEKARAYVLRNTTETSAVKKTASDKPAPVACSQHRQKPDKEGVSTVEAITVAVQKHCDLPCVAGIKEIAGCGTVVGDSSSSTVDINCNTAREGSVAVNGHVVSRGDDAFVQPRTVPQKHKPVVMATDLLDFACSGATLKSDVELSEASDPEHYDESAVFGLSPIKAAGRLLQSGMTPEKLVCDSDSSDDIYNFLGHRSDLVTQTHFAHDVKPIAVAQNPIEFSVGIPVDCLASAQTDTPPHLQYSKLNNAQKPTDGHAIITGSAASGNVSPGCTSDGSSLVIDLQASPAKSASSSSGKAEVSVFTTTDTLSPITAHRELAEENPSASPRRNPNTNLLISAENYSRSLLGGVGGDVLVQADQHREVPASREEIPVRRRTHVLSCTQRLADESRGAHLGVTREYRETTLVCMANVGGGDGVTESDTDSRSQDTTLDSSGLTLDGRVDDLTMDRSSGGARPVLSNDDGPRSAGGEQENIIPGGDRIGREAVEMKVPPTGAPPGGSIVADALQPRQLHRGASTDRSKHAGECRRDVTACRRDDNTTNKRTPLRTTSVDNDDDAEDEIPQLDGTSDEKGKPADKSKVAAKRTGKEDEGRRKPEKELGERDGERRKSSAGAANKLSPERMDCDNIASDGGGDVQTGGVCEDDVLALCVSENECISDTEGFSDRTPKKRNVAEQASRRRRSKVPSDDGDRTSERSSDSGDGRRHGRDDIKMAAAAAPDSSRGSREGSIASSFGSMHTRSESSGDDSMSEEALDVTLERTGESNARDRSSEGPARTRMEAKVQSGAKERDVGLGGSKSGTKSASTAGHPGNSGSNIGCDVNMNKQVDESLSEGELSSSSGDENTTSHVTRADRGAEVDCSIASKFDKETPARVSTHTKDERSDRRKGKLPSTNMKESHTDSHKGKPASTPTDNSRSESHKAKAASTHRDDYRSKSHETKVASTHADNSRSESHKAKAASTHRRKPAATEPAGRTASDGKPRARGTEAMVKAVDEMREANDLSDGELAEEEESEGEDLDKLAMKLQMLQKELLLLAEEEKQKKSAVVTATTSESRDGGERPVSSPVQKSGDLVEEKLNRASSNDRKASGLPVVSRHSRDITYHETSSTSSGSKVKGKPSKEDLKKKKKKHERGTEADTVEKQRRHAEGAGGNSSSEVKTRLTDDKERNRDKQKKHTTTDETSRKRKLERSSDKLSHPEKRRKANIHEEHEKPAPTQPLAQKTKVFPEKPKLIKDSKPSGESRRNARDEDPAKEHKRVSSAGKPSEERRVTVSKVEVAAADKKARDDRVSISRSVKTDTADAERRQRSPSDPRSDKSKSRWHLESRDVETRSRDVETKSRGAESRLAEREKGVDKSRRRDEGGAVAGSLTGRRSLAEDVVAASLVKQSSSRHKPEASGAEKSEASRKAEPTSERRRRGSDERPQTRVVERDKADRKRDGKEVARADTQKYADSGKPRDKRREDDRVPTGSNKDRRASSQTGSQSDVSHRRSSGKQRDRSSQAGYSDDESSHQMSFVGRRVFHEEPSSRRRSLGHDTYKSSGRSSPADARRPNVRARDFSPGSTSKERRREKPEGKLARRVRGSPSFSPLSCERASRRTQEEMAPLSGERASRRRQEGTAQWQRSLSRSRTSPRSDRSGRRYTPRPEASGKRESLERARRVRSARDDSPRFEVSGKRASLEGSRRRGRSAWDDSPSSDNFPRYESPATEWRRSARSSRADSARSSTSREGASWRNSSPDEPSRQLSFVGRMLNRRASPDAPAPRTDPSRRRRSPATRERGHDGGEAAARDGRREHQTQRRASPGPESARTDARRTSRDADRSQASTSTSRTNKEGATGVTDLRAKLDKRVLKEPKTEKSRDVDQGERRSEAKTKAKLTSRSDKGVREATELDRKRSKHMDGAKEKSQGIDIKRNEQRKIQSVAGLSNYELEASGDGKTRSETRPISDSGTDVPKRSSKSSRRHDATKTKPSKPRANDADGSEGKSSQECTASKREGVTEALVQCPGLGDSANLLQRHVNQMFVKGDNVVMVSIAD